MSIRPKGIDTSGLFITRDTTIPSFDVKGFDSTIVNTNNYTAYTTPPTNTIKNVNPIVNRALSPSGLTYISSTATSVTFSFTAPSGVVSGYTPYVNGATGTYSGTGTPSSYTISGLSGATTYSISMVAFNAISNSLLSTSVNMTTLPSPPTNLQFIGSTVNSVTFRFTAPGGTVTGYTPYVNGSTGTYSGSGTTTSYTITGLSAATAYSITMIAYNAIGNSFQSSALSMTTIPNAPTGITIISSTISTVTFSFTAPSGSVTGYTPYVNGTTGTYSGSGTPTSYTITGLSSATAYSISMVAYNIGGNSAQSTAVNITTLPNAPTALTFTSSTVSSVTFSFTAPTGTITGYTPYVNGSATTGSGSASAYTISGLSSATTYSILMVAYNTGGNSAQSTSANMTTIPAAPTGLTYVSSTTNSVTFRFTAPSGTIFGYTPYINGSTGTYSGSGTVSSYTITGLSSASAYTVTMVAYGTTGSNSAQSTGVSMTTLPTAPTGLTFISSTGNTITLSFTAPSGTITGYIPYVNGSPTSGSGTATSYTITSLTALTTYAITMVAYNTAGNSAQSSSVNMTTTLNAPTGLTFINATTSTITFSFTDSNGASTSGYTLYVNGTTGTYSGSGTTSSYTITGLPTTATSYSISMMAYNGAVNSAQSSAVNMYTIPNAPTGLTFISATSSSVTFSFTAPSGTITGYTPYVNGTAGTGSGTATSYTVTGLSLGTTYAISLIASNAGGNSAYSSAVNMTTTISFGTSALTLYLPMNNDLLNYSSGTGVSYASSATGVSYSNGVTPPSNLGAYSIYNNGNSNYVNLNSTLSFPNGGMSMSFWVYPQYTQTAPYICLLWLGDSFTSANNRVFIFLNETTTNLNFTFGYWAGGTTYRTGMNTNSSYSYNNWYHIVWNITSTGVNNIYVNGSNQVSNLNAGFYPTLSHAASQFFREQISTSSHYTGYLKEFRIYNTVLTQSQVNTLYNSGNGNLYPGI